MLLLQRLCERGILTEINRRVIEEIIAVNPNKPIHDIILEKGFAKEETVLQAIAEEFGLELVDLSQRHIEPEILAVMPTKLVHRKNLFPIDRHNGTLVVATGDPFDVYALD